MSNHAVFELLQLNYFQALQKLILNLHEDKTDPNVFVGACNQPEMPLEFTKERVLQI